MLLSDRDIQRKIDSDAIVIDPYSEEMLQPSSVDVHLGDSFVWFDPMWEGIVDPSLSVPAETRRVLIPTDGSIDLAPGEFMLASTLERVQLPNDVAARLEGRSSLGRIGLLIHASAGFIDAGFTGQLTLELSNLASRPIRLRPGMSIGQLCFFQLTSEVLHSYGSAVYGSKYQGQMGATASRGLAPEHD